MDREFFKGLAFTHFFHEVSGAQDKCFSPVSNHPRLAPVNLSGSTYHVSRYIARKLQSTSLRKSHHPVSLIFDKLTCLTKSSISSSQFLSEGYLDNPVISPSSGIYSSQSQQSPMDYHVKLKSENANTDCMLRRSVLESVDLRLCQNDAVRVAYADVYQMSTVLAGHLPATHQAIISRSQHWDTRGKKITWSSFCDYSKSILENLLPHAGIRVYPSNDLSAVESFTGYSRKLASLMGHQLFSLIEVDFESINADFLLACNQVCATGKPNKVCINDNKRRKIARVVGLIFAENLSEISSACHCVVDLDSLALIKYDIPDQRLLYSENTRVIEEFQRLESGNHDKFQMVSYFPPLWRHDLSFWEPEDFDERKLLEIIENICGDAVRPILLMNVWKEPRTGRVSRCYREVYQSPEWAITHDLGHSFQNKVRLTVAREMGVELK